MRIFILLGIFGFGWTCFGQQQQPQDKCEPCKKKTNDAKVSCALDPKAINENERASSDVLFDTHRMRRMIDTEQRKLAEHQSIESMEERHSKVAERANRLGEIHSLALGICKETTRIAEGECKSRGCEFKVKKELEREAEILGAQEKQYVQLHSDSMGISNLSRYQELSDMSNLRNHSGREPTLATPGQACAISDCLPPSDNLEDRRK